MTMTKSSHWLIVCALFGTAACGGENGLEIESTSARVSTGTGLRGEYYDNSDLSGLKLTRNDSQINFDWGWGAPDSTVGADTFSVRWTGQIEPLYSQTYTFYVTSDDGARLWINGQNVIDNWIDQAARETSGSIALSAGQRVDIRLEAYENGGLAAAKLAWSSASQPKQIVAQSQLYPAGTASGAACAVVPENNPLTLSCPSGQTIATVEFASYGTPEGSCGSFSTGSCDATESMSTVANACVGQSSCTLWASNWQFGDPCWGTAKRLAVQAACSGGSTTTGTTTTSSTTTSSTTTSTTTTGGGTTNPGTAWRPFSADSPWNTPIDANAKVDPNSAALVSDFATSSPWPFFTINIQSYSVPVYYVDGSTPPQTVRATVVGGQGFETGSAQVPIPVGAMPAEGTDRHLSIVNKQTNQEWGMWDTANGSGWTCSVCAMADLAGTGVRPPTQNPPWWMGHGARACGFPLSAGLITVDEMRQGSIEHALVIAYPHIRSRYYTPPASTAQTTTDLALGTRGVPCGGRFQLDPSVNLDTLGLSPSGKIVARALQKYGAFVGDFSLAVSLYAEAGPAALAAWNGLLGTYEIKDQIGLNRLRVLEVGSLYDNAN